MTRTADAQLFSPEWKILTVFPEVEVQNIDPDTWKTEYTPIKLQTGTTALDITLFQIVFLMLGGECKIVYKNHSLEYQ